MTMEESKCRGVYATAQT